MSAFEAGEEETTDAPAALKEGGASASSSASSSSSSRVARKMVDYNAPVAVIYHPTSGIPAEFCEFSETFDADLPWILDNCPEAISPDKLAKVMAKELAKASLAAGEDAPAGAPEKKESVKGAGITMKKAKAGPGECRVVISRVQRQKKKFITSVVGMETVPDVKLKDAAKVFGKKFASGASVSTNAAGDDEITIQGDVQFDLPALLMSQFKVPPTSIYFQDKDRITAFA